MERRYEPASKTPEPVAPGAASTTPGSRNRRTARATVSLANPSVEASERTDTWATRDRRCRSSAAASPPARPTRLARVLTQFVSPGTDDDADGGSVSVQWRLPRRVPPRRAAAPPGLSHEFDQRPPRHPVTLFAELDHGSPDVPPEFRYS